MTSVVIPATCVMLTVGIAIPSVYAEPQCKPIVAVQRDALVTENCTSPIGFCAGGTITGNRGLCGTTFFSGLSFDPIPGDPDGRLAVPGVSTFTTDDGVLTISDVSVFDVQRGAFAGIGRIEEGTGQFAGATGDIFNHRPRQRRRDELRDRHHWYDLSALGTQALVAAA
jgi:hypothetical protein